MKEESLYKGKQLKDLTREELYEAVVTLGTLYGELLQKQSTPLP